MTPEGVGGASPAADPQEVDLTGLPVLLRPAQVARIYGIGVRTLIRWVNREELPCTRTLGGHRRYRTADVAAHLARAGIPPEQIRALIWKAAV